MYPSGRTGSIDRVGLVENILDFPSKRGREMKARESRVGVGVDGETVNCTEFTMVECTISFMDGSDVVRYKRKLGRRESISSGSSKPPKGMARGGRRWGNKDRLGHRTGQDGSGVREAIDVGSVGEPCVDAGGAGGGKGTDDEEA